MQEILVTMGAYQAVFCAIQALVYEGDEVSPVKYLFIYFSSWLYLDDYLKNAVTKLIIT